MKISILIFLISSICFAGPIYDNATIENYLSLPFAISGAILTVDGSGNLSPKIISTSDLPASGVTPGSYTNADLTVDIQGRLISVSNGSPGGVTSVSGSSPLVSTGGSTPIISLPQSTSGADGYLSSIDWTTFNSKASIQYVDNQIASIPYPISSALAPLTMVGTQIQIPIATSGANGYLSSIDWSTFNSKQPSGSYAITTRNINTTSPIVGGGDLSSDRTISMPVATSSADGYISFTDWNIFNGKGSVSNINTATGLSGGPIITSGTLSVDVGTNVGQIVQVQAGSKLPSLDGFSVTGLNPANISGVLGVSVGGTGYATYISGGLLVANTPSTISQIPNGTTGQVLTWGTNGWAPATASGSITLPLSLANGGTAAALTAVAGGIVYSSGASMRITAAGTNGQALLSRGTTTAPNFGTLGFAGGGTGATTFANQRLPFSNGTILTSDALYIYDTTNTRLQVGGSGTARVNAIVSSGSTVALQAYQQGTNNAFQAMGQGSTAYTIATVNRANTALGGASIGGEFGRGTLATPLQSLSGDQLFSLTAQGYTGANTVPGFAGAISFIATENSTNTTSGGDIVISPTPNGTVNPVEAVRFKQSGALNISNLTASMPIKTNGSKDLISSLILLPTDVSGILDTAYGGLGLSTPASMGGLLPITTSGGSYSLAHLTAGTGININNASGSIIIEAAGGSGANQSLSNLVPTSINQDLVFGSGQFGRISTVSEPSIATQGLDITTGTSSGNNNGGISIHSADVASIGASSGDVNINPGSGLSDAGGPYAGNGGDLNISGGGMINPNGEVGGILNLLTPTFNGTEGAGGFSSGAINIKTGVSGANAGVSGDITIQTGDSPVTTAGSITIKTGSTGGTQGSIYLLSQAGFAGVQGDIFVDAYRFFIQHAHITFSNASAPPTATPDANAGIGATCTINSSSDDNSGRITLVTGATATASGSQCLMTFNRTWSAAQVICTLSPVDSGAGSSYAANSPFFPATTTTLDLQFGIAALGAGTYTWNYHCNGLN